ESLTILSTGTARFDGAIGPLNPLKTLAVTATTAIALNGGTVQTAQDQDYTGPVILNAASQVTTLTGANIRFLGNASALRGLVDGVESLVVESSGSTRFDGAIGAAERLRNLEVSAAGSIELNAGVVRTTQDQTYTGPVVLNAAADLTTLTGRNITFSGPGSTLAGALDGVESLNVSSTGTARFDGTIGALNRLRSLDLAAISALALQGGSITTTDDQRYTGPVLLDAASNSTTLTGRDITFAGAATTLRGTLDGIESLSVSSSGVARFEGAIGDTTRLDNFTVSATTAIDLQGGQARTLRDQRYTGAIRLDSSVNATTLSGRDITFSGGGSTINGLKPGEEQLTVTGTRVVRVDGAVGLVGALNGLALSATSRIDLNAGSVVTTLDQRYTGAVRLDSSSD
ncbi:MAG: hypothetical protein ACKOJF_32980, partial [Planctomycetaceae bacterium]